MLISPTEPTTLRALGHTSWLTEAWGADVLIPHDGTFVGVQRKEVGDLLASLHDGRLAKEVAQMQRLALAVLVVEGRCQWGLDGALLNTRTPWTRTAHRNLLRSVQAKGVCVEFSDSLADTVALVESLAAWIAKGDHNSVLRRPGPDSVWGKADSREYQQHFLQGLPGVGPKLADAILDHFGRVPMAWTANEAELAKVPGIGKKRARVLHQALAPPDPDAA